MEKIVRSASLAAAFLGATLDGAGAVTVDFSDDGTFSAPSVTEGIVTVSGSAAVSAEQYFGLGILGGDRDYRVDNLEWILFSFSQAVQNVRYFVSSAGQDISGPNDPTLLGERFLETLPAGLFPEYQDSAGWFSVSADPIQAFRLTALNGEYFNVLQVSFDIVPDTTTGTVPLPASLPLLCAGLAAVPIVRRRKR